MELVAGPVLAAPIPTIFASTGADRSAIENLLTTYTIALLTKNQVLFESLLLDKDIPFLGVGAADRSGVAKVVMTNYDSFRKGVFEGPAFT